jgi:NitT/TauT family transport system permease protein
VTHREVLRAQLLLAGAVLALWELLPRLGWIDPVFIPPPSRVVEALVHLWSLGVLGEHTRLSLGRALGGFGVAVVIGPLLGLALGGWFPRLRQALEPLMEFFSQANPVVLFHVVLLFLGIGESAKVFLIAWLCIWPIAFASIAGVTSVDPELLRAARAFCLSRPALFVRVVVPAALPSIFTALRLAAGQSFIMLIAAEMMGASSGLGWLVVQSQESYHAPRIFAAAALISGLALVTDRILLLLEARLIRWRPPLDEGRVLLSGGSTER